MLALKRSIFNKELILINVLKALASVISMCSLHVINPLIDDYTQIFYMTDEGNIPSLECKMSWPKYEKSGWPESYLH
jgi:hypothetical protein